MQHHGRREFIAAVGVTAAGVGVGSAVATASGGTTESPERAAVDQRSDSSLERTHADVPREADDATRAFLRGIVPGVVAGGWTVVAVHAPFQGGLPVLLERDGAQLQLDILAAGEGPEPVARTQHLAVYAEGDVAPRLAAEAAVSVAEHLEGRMPSELDLVSFEERTRRFPYAVYSVRTA